MTHFTILDEDIDISGYYLIEGLPGIGLVAKISADYIIDQLNMELYAEIYGRDLPKVPVFKKENPVVKPAVRIFVDSEKEIAVLKSDAPVSVDAEKFMEDVMSWIGENNLKPIFQVGLPVEVEEGEHYMFHVESGEVDGVEGAELNNPPISGGMTGPTGALLHQALETETDAVGLVIESDPNFPDPEASRILIEDGIKKITGIDIDTEQLKESADQIKQQKQELIKQVKDLNQQESNEVYPREMYK
jgi:uncharacterized protein